NCKIDVSAKLGELSPMQNKKDKTIIGSDSTVRSGSVIYAGTKIGNGFYAAHNVIIREKNIIGSNFKIWNNSVIDYGCKIGNNVKIHCNCYISQYTIIEDNVFLAPGVITTNDPHPGCKYSKECMRGPKIKKNAKVGANSVILPFVTIGKGALIGSGSVVTKDIPPNSVAYGSPAKVHRRTSSITCLFDYTDRPYPQKRKRK
ncbi:MAG: acyltransferase, partial [Elusimicrobiota bacterium]